MPIPRPPHRRPFGDLVPVWRTPTTLQVGLDDDVLVLEPVPPLTDDLVWALSTGADRHDDADPAWQQWLLDRFAEHGRLGDRVTPRSIRIIGSGSVAHRLAELLLDLGHTVHIKDETPVPGARGTAAHRLVAQLRHGPRRQGGRAVVDAGGAVSLTVVCTGTCEPDRSLTDSLTRRRDPWLVIRTRPGVAIAGPLVLPGETSCVRCADLWRAQADPVWPRLAAQLSHRTAPDDPLVDSWVTAVALAQIVAFLNDERGELRSRTLTLSADTGRTTLRVWPPHPDCVCGTRRDGLGKPHSPDRIGA